MAISYSAITNYGKITLPSVESFGANMNILRDPPKSITTRRIDKVGETSEITSMIDDSPDRISGLNEYILQFARGVNPMVEVSFDGWNGGGNGRLNQQSQGKLPYRILHGGAFRPPIKDQRELLPLSRLPRTATSSFTNPGFADFSKKTLCFNPDAETKGVKSFENVLRQRVNPTAVYIFPSLEAPNIKPLETKNYIKENLLQVPVSSGKNSSARFNGEKGEPVKQIKENLKAPVNFNKGGTSKKKGENKVEIERYTKDVLQGKYSTNSSQNIKVSNIDDILYSAAVKSTKDTMNISHEGYRRGPEKTEYLHDDIQLERSLPVYEQHTNSGRNIHKPLEDVVYREFAQNRPSASMQTNSRGLPGMGDQERQDYHLKPTLSLGGYEMNVKLPETYHENQQVEFDRQRETQRRKVYDLQQERNTSLNIPYQPFETPV